MMASDEIAREDARTWFATAYDLLDRLPGTDARTARNLVADVADTIGNDASGERCADAMREVRLLVQRATRERVAHAILIVMGEYARDGIAHEYELLGAEDVAGYARSVLTLPGHHAIGGHPIDYDGSDAARAFVVVVAADDAALADALGIARA